MCPRGRMGFPPLFICTYGVATVMVWQTNPERMVLRADECMKMTAAGTRKIWMEVARRRGRALVSGMDLRGGRQHALRCGSE